MRARHSLPFFLLAVLGLVDSASAQPYWTRHVGSLGNDHVSDVKVDESGAIYITGEFSGDADFTDSVFTSSGALDCFVAKMTPEGEISWFVRGGGLGIDRGISLAFGPGNTLAVVGEFQGVANFQGTTITSQAYTPDMFCMVLDRATGALQWIRHGGGALGSDRPYGVTVSASGQVTMAGEFKGSAIWDGSSLVSTPDQDSGEPTMDVVIVSYSANGTLLWTKQGVADREDRAIGLVHDDAGNLFVAGQFSDTISFDLTHLNAMYNATFLLKLDAAGNEQWFRRIGGGIYGHVRDMLAAPGGGLLLLGDLQGTMLFMDDVPDMIAGESPYNYYLLKVDAAGQLAAQGQLGSSNGLSARGLDMRNDTISVIGQFNCRFNALGDHYGGSGLFMAAGEEDIFVTRHRWNDLGFIEARHFGGSGGKLAGHVATLPNGDVIACGSYERSIAFATTTANVISGDEFNGYVPTPNPPNPPGCPELANKTFRAQDAMGLMDGFISRAYVRDSVVFDWWRQLPGACNHPATWSMCAGQAAFGQPCPDTLTFCGPGSIGATLPFIPAFGNSNSMGPLVTAAWSSGDSTLSIIAAQTGDYAVTVSAANGCWAWTDAVHVIVHPEPPKPQLSDDMLVNAAATVTEPIILCDPDQALIWCDNMVPGATGFWTASNAPGDTLFGPGIQVDTTGHWVFTMVTAEGCSDTTTIDVLDLSTPSLACLNGDMNIVYGSDSIATDSLSLCHGDTLSFTVTMQWTCDGDSTAFPNDLIFTVSFNGGDPETGYDPDGWSQTIDNWQTGWYHLWLHMTVTNSPCGGDTLTIDLQDSIWVAGWPEGDLDMSIAGPATLCQGDSVLYTLFCHDCDSTAWTGPGLGGLDSTSAWVLQPGNYNVLGSMTDEHGCVTEEQVYFHVSAPLGPLLQILPADGIICPADSALIFTTMPGTDQVWYGPFGPVPNGSPEIWSGVPGEYYLSMTDAYGCAVVSNPALLTGYSTPYLNLIPDNVLCLGEESAIIQVMTTAPSTIVWAPPLSGGGLTQTVTQPGTYSVSSTACGITTVLSVTVVASTVSADVLEDGPISLCEGESITLHAAPGAAVYIWQPGNIFADSLTVSAAGTYQLQVLDGNGCADTSDAVIVDVHAIGEALAAAGDTICEGQPAILSANGSGNLVWYADAGVQQPLFTGSPITLNGIVQDTVFFVQQTDGPCVSGALTVPVHVDPSPPPVGVDAPGAVCGGGVVTVGLVAPPGVDAQWTTPGGALSGTSITIDDFSADDAGLYTAVPFIGGCAGAPVSAFIAFTAPLPIDLGPDTTYCIGGYTVLGIPAWYTAPQWSTGATGFTVQVGNDGLVTVQAVDSNGCPVQDEVVLTGVDCEPRIPNVITPNGDGNNDGVTITGSSGFTLHFRLWNRWGQVVWEGGGQDIHWSGRHQNGDVLPDGVYYYELLRAGSGGTEAYTGYIHVLKGR